MNIIKAILPNMRISRYVRKKYNIKFLYAEESIHYALVCVDKKLNTRIILMNKDKFESIREGKEV